jgi:hypothetical protein
MLKPIEIDRELLPRSSASRWQLASRRLRHRDHRDLEAEHVDHRSQLLGSLLDVVLERSRLIGLDLDVGCAFGIQRVLVSRNRDRCPVVVVRD